MSRTADFSKICTDCENHSQEGVFHQCSAQRCLVTGRTIKVSCGSQRSKAGCCGPDGLRYTAREVVVRSGAGGTADKSKGGGAAERARVTNVRVLKPKTPERV